jgi:hypothetical protein
VEALCALESFVVNCSKTSWWWTARDMVLRHCIKSWPKDPHSMPLVNWVRSGDLRKNKGAAMTRNLLWHAWCRGAAKGLSPIDRFERMCMPHKRGDIPFRMNMPPCDFNPSKSSVDHLILSWVVHLTKHIETHGRTKQANMHAFRNCVYNILLWNTSWRCD